MTLSRDLSGTGAMLVRLLGVGARGGLTADAVLLHVLDGVPLSPSGPREGDPVRLAALKDALVRPTAAGHVDGATHPAEPVAQRVRTPDSGPGDEGFQIAGVPELQIPAQRAEDILASLKAKGPGPVLPVDDEDESLCFEFPEADDPAQQDRLDELNSQAMQRELGTEPGPATAVSRKPWSPTQGSKADQALILWSTTQMDVVAIAELLGSTPGAIRSVIKKARVRGEPRAERPAAIVAPEITQAIAEVQALPLKRDRAILLWQRTRLRPREIATLIGSTPPSVSFYMKEARRAGSAAVLEGDRLRGIANSGAAASNEAPMTVHGVGENGATALSGTSDIIPSAGISGEDGRVLPAPDVSPEGADQGRGFESRRYDAAAAASLRSAAVAQGWRVTPSTRVSPEGAEEACTEPVATTTLVSIVDVAGHRFEIPIENWPPPAETVLPPQAEEACAEPVDEPNYPGLADGAFPAPHEVETPIEMGTVSQDKPEASGSTPPADPDTAARPAGPGLNSDAAPVEQAIAAMVAGLAKKVAPRVETMLDLYGATTRLQKDIAAELGLTGAEVSTTLKVYRAGQDPRVAAGDAARAALKRSVPTDKAPPVPAAEALPAVSAPVTAAAAEPPAPGTAPPGDLVELKHDQVLAIDRGWIVGPDGAVKGFTLINGALMALATGELFPAAAIAKKSGVRSGEAVLAQLNFWRDDLARIGIEVVKVGPTDIRLRRKEGA